MSVYDGEAIKRTEYLYNSDITDYKMCIFGPINRGHNIGKYPSKHDTVYFISLLGNLKELVQEVFNPTPAEPIKISEFLKNF